MRAKAAVAIILVALVTGALALSASLRHDRRVLMNNASRLVHGDPTVAPDKIRKYGCYGCHTIPGVDGANGLVGPPLTGISARVFIAGELPNTPHNIVHWIQHPREINPHTAMPEMGVTEQDSRDIAAYLYSLK